jgi:hypothetical protein
METLKPKCSNCKCYYIPSIKSSGLPYKTCDKCRSKRNCEHNRAKSRCNECGGSEICEHNKRKSQCKDCGGSSICEHNKRKSQCKECDGSEICEHNKRKSNCKECGGSSFCEHNKRKSTCKECNFKVYLVNLQRGQINRCFKLSKNNKNKHSIEYLGCSIEQFIEYFQKKIDYFNQYLASDVIMTYDNIHIDHIKPVSRFNLDDEDEFLDCCSYTNLQPLLTKDNLEKHNKWNENNEKYWQNNIKDKEYYEIYLVV